MDQQLTVPRSNAQTHSVDTPPGWYRPAPRAEALLVRSRFLRSNRDPSHTLFSSCSIGLCWGRHRRLPAVFRATIRHALTHRIALSFRAPSPSTPRLDRNEGLSMNDQRPVLTFRNAWFQTYSGSAEALLDWFALPSSARSRAIITTTAMPHLTVRTSVLSRIRTHESQWGSTLHHQQEVSLRLWSRQ
jgi:hypothetical protein